MRLREREKISSVFVAEATSFLLAFSFAALVSEIYMVFHADADMSTVFSFPFWEMGALLLFCILERIFNSFAVSRTVSLFFSLIPSMVLLLMLRRIDALKVLQLALIFAAIIRICICFIQSRRCLLVITVLLIDITTLYLYFAGYGIKGSFVSEKLLCVFLVTLTMYSLQMLFLPKGMPPFPIHLFLCITILSAIVPMKTAPIDWTPLIRAGEKIKAGIESTSDNALYFFSTAFGGTYTAGYSSLSGSGGRLENTDRVQLILETDSLPYHTYQNLETKSFEKVRRTLYLAGGTGGDCAPFVSFLNFLYQNSVTEQEASLFSEQESIDLEYMYLDTYDEIAPSGTFFLSAKGHRVDSGISTSLHRKGYRLSSRYLDIDYASPYLAELLRSESADFALSYEDACDYAKELWGIDLREVLSASLYEKTLRNLKEDRKNVSEMYLDVTGADERLSVLADDITKGSLSDYEKCRKIEMFLRQYAYSEDSVGGYDDRSDMSSSRGMSDISSRFLFATGRGYCVHFTSSMVMLLRLSGIPARAVSGFRYAFPFEKADEYRVNSSCAHTWPEAYISGAGWIPFEPTSGYYSQSDRSWHRYMDQGGKDSQPDLPEVPPLPEKESTDTGNENAISDRSVLLAISVLWPFVLSAVSLLLLLIGGTRLLRLVAYRYASPARQLLSDAQIIKRNLVRLSGQNIPDRGLLSDYVRLAPADMQKDVSKVFSVCYRILYGKGKETSPTPAENALAKSVREKLKSKRAFPKSSA